VLNVAREPTYLESRWVPSTFTGDTVEQIAPELAEVEWELAKAKRDQTKIRYNAGAARDAVTRVRPATTVLTSLCEGTLAAALISLPAEAAGPPRSRSMVATSPIGGWRGSSGS
jgi:hypothetical protein